MSRRNPTAGRHRAEPTRRPRSGRAGGSLLSATGLLAAALLGVVATAGGTYALLGSSATAPASVITSGSAGLTISSVSALDVTALGPGRAVSGTFVAKNTGTVALGLRLAGTTPKSSDAAVLNELTATTAVLASGGSCTASTTGTKARPATLDTGASWTTLAAGQSVTGCLVLTLDSDAPSSLQGRTAPVSFVLSGTQVAP